MYVHTNSVFPKTRLVLVCIKMNSIFDDEGEGDETTRKRLKNDPTQEWHICTTIDTKMTLKWRKNDAKITETCHKNDMEYDTLMTHKITTKNDTIIEKHTKQRYNNDISHIFHWKHKNNKIKRRK